MNDNYQDEYATVENANGKGSLCMHVSVTCTMQFNMTLYENQMALLKVTDKYLLINHQVYNGGAP